MQDEQQLSKEKSLEIIQQMITQAKTNITDNGLGWLLWGSMIIVAAVSTFVFIEMDADQVFLGWNIFGIVTVVLLLWGVFKPKRKKVSTYLDDLLRLADIGFIISLFIVIFAINVAVHPNAGFGFIMMIFGMYMLIKGGAVKSKALMAGAVVNWAGAIGMFLNKDFKYDMLIMAAAVLIGYIIPGIILWQQYRKTNKRF